MKKCTNIITCCQVGELLHITKTDTPANICTENEAD